MERCEGGSVRVGRCEGGRCEVGRCEGGWGDVRVGGEV